jgi:flagellar motor switch protein FliM
VDRLSAQHWFASAREDQTAQHIDALKKRVKKASLELQAELGQTDLTVKDLLYLKNGDVVRLNKQADEKMDIRIGNNIKYQGVAGTKKKQRAIKITDVVDEEERGEEDE